MASLKLGQAVDVGLPVGQLGIGIDEPGQRALHLREGIGGLRQHAERDLPGEVLRRRHDDRKHRRGLAVEGGEPGQPLGVRHEAHQVR